MHRSKRSARVVAGTIVATGVLLAPVVASAAPTSLSPQSPSAASSATPALAGTVAAGHHPFRVRIGHKFYIVTHMRGIRAHDKLMLEYFNNRRRHGRWFVLGGWKLHRGQRFHQFPTKAIQTGLYPLRTFIRRHHHAVRGSFSHVFRVRVLGKKHKIRNPRHVATAPSASGATGGVVSDWTLGPCGSQGDLGERGYQNKMYVNPPPEWSQMQQGSQYLINVVVWESTYTSSGWSPWGQPAWTMQKQLVPDVRTGAYGETISVPIWWRDPNDNGETVPTLETYDLNYSSDTYHLFAWDLQYSTDGGFNWYYVSPNAWYTPYRYLQDPKLRPGQGGQQYYSNTCATWQYVP